MLRFTPLSTTCPSRLVFAIFLALAPLVWAQSAAQTPFKVYEGAEKPDNPLEHLGARICFTSQKPDLCWKFDDGTGQDPKAREIPLPAGGRLFAFTAVSMGGSDGDTSIALLEERKQQLVNLLPDTVEVSSNDGEWDAWQMIDVSAMPILVTADKVWCKNENRFSAHRYKIATYTYNAATKKYAQRSSYTTTKTYAGNAKVLEAEKPAIVSKLKSLSGKPPAAGARGSQKGK